ncbi:hypothetical protein EON65_55915, partial [archaeon]
MAWATSPIFCHSCVVINKHACYSTCGQGCFISLALHSVSELFVLLCFCFFVKWVGLRVFCITSVQILSLVSFDLFFASAGLPSFFQTSAPTLLDEFLEEDGRGIEEDALDGLIDPVDPSQDLETFGEDETFGFGDLKVESLPDFFTAPKMGDMNISSAPAKSSYPIPLSAHSMPPPR